MFPTRHPKVSELLNQGRIGAGLMLSANGTLLTKTSARIEKIRAKAGLFRKSQKYAIDAVANSGAQKKV
jgi:hypothetical protein